jgi:hypothetical protein
MKELRRDIIEIESATTNHGHQSHILRIRVLSRNYINIDKMYIYACGGSDTKKFPNNLLKTRDDKFVCLPQWEN